MILARGPVLAWLVVGQLLVATLARGGDQPPTSDTALAQKLSERALAAEQQGDRRHAARWRLRAERWDPSRVSDLRRGVVHLESYDRPAAVRQVARLLEVDSTFGLSDPSLLLRLKGAAIERDTTESFSVAAQLTRRLVRWAEARPGLSPSRVANLWREVGELHGTAGEGAECSDAFDELQRLAVTHEAELDLGSARWDIIADLHLEVGEVDRAAVAIGLLANAHGDIREVLAGRARVALQLGEPMAAVTHAKRAIDAEPEWDSDPPYAELVAALRGINQGDRVAPRLRRYYTDRPGDLTLAGLLIDSLLASGEEEEAWILSGELLDRYLDSKAGGDMATLAEVAARHLELASESARHQEVLDLLPRLAAAFDSPEVLLEIAKPLLEDKRMVGHLGRWSERIALQLKDGNAPLGARRVVVAIGTAVGRPAAASTCLRSRLEEKLAAHEDLESVAAELDFVVLEATLKGDHTTAVRHLRWFLEKIPEAYSVDGEGVRERIGLACLDLAESLIETADDDPAVRQEVLDKLAESGRLMPDSPAAVASQVYSFYRLKAYDEAIIAGEIFLEKWPRPTAKNGVEEYTHRAAVHTLASALVARRALGDGERAVECYEDLLDRWPDDSGVLNSLAYEWASPGKPLARAERMARRAVELDGDNPHVIDTLGWIVYQQGRYAEAAEILAKAVVLAEAGAETSEQSVLQEHYAEALRRQGRAEEAESQDAD